MKKASFFFITIGLFLLLHASSAHALSLGFVPTSQNVALGDPVSVDLTISGIGEFPSLFLSTFNLLVTFDSSILAFKDGSFGLLLGDPLLGEASTVIGRTIFSDVIRLSELSFLEGNSVTCIFCIPPFLADLQPASFTLATLTFNTKAAGVSPLTFFIVDTLGDAEGNSLVADVSGGSVTVIPEPSTLLFVGSGLAVFVVLRRKQVGA